MNTYLIFGDGGSRGNPGQSASGYIIYKANKIEDFDLKKIENYKSDSQIITQNGEYLGIKTNNEAEWMSLYFSLEYIKNNIDISQEDRVLVFLDSNLVINQVSGKWKIKEPRLKELYLQVKKIIDSINCQISYQHVYREFNKEADAEVNKCLDNR